MLVLTRKVGEEIIIDGIIRVAIGAVQNGRVRLGITAPADVHILRSELEGTPVTTSVPPPNEVDADLEQVLVARARSLSSHLESARNRSMADVDQPRTVNKPR